MDEMIELFSVLNELEKGALGLFFEMNYFVGVSLSIYITWFVCSYDPPNIDCSRVGAERCEIKKVLSGKLGLGKSTIGKEDYDQMYQWLYFHFIYMFVSLLFSVIVLVIYRKINKQVTTKEAEKPTKIADK